MINHSSSLSGKLIKGYELHERVGSGGFGAVFRAIQASVGREVAIKVILPEHANQPDFVRRFEVEAQLIARLEHPHIVPLYDYWRDPEGAFLVMRWLRGNLRASLREGAWSVDAVAHLLEQLASALMVAHREGVIHRDIKPDNILLDEDNNAYLADFGIAKDLNVANNTDEGKIVGSPAYITPEQIKGELLTPRTDIYSLGLVIYEILANEAPFPEAKTPAELISRQLNTPIPHLHTLRPNLPAGIDEVLQTATAKNPAQRYINVMRFAQAFRASLPSAQLPINKPMLDAFSERELGILRLMSDGLTIAQMANQLGLSSATVRWYMKQIYTRLDVTGRRQAVNRAKQLNLFAIASPSGSPHAPLAQERIHTLRTLVLLEQTDLVNPYRGLQPFEESDASFFFGRAALIKRFLDRLSVTDEGSRFLAVVGPSGSGKSSAVKAGLIPALRKGAILKSDRWFVTEMVPGTHPLEELEAALLRVSINPLPDLLDQLTDDQRGLVRAVKRMLPLDPNVELVLVVDQAEELFTLVKDDAARLHFIDNLVNVVTDPRSRMRIILTLRADFYDRPLMFPHLAELMRRHTELIIPMNASELERAIAAPAERVGLTMEAGLVATIIKDVGEQPGTLPLLQYALAELFERRKDHLLTLDAYRESGGLSGALARRADNLYNGLDDEGQTAARHLFMRLITLGEGTEDTRRRVQQAELDSLMGANRALDDVITDYEQYRLLTFDRDPITRGPTVEIAHEALIREWGRLREWLRESREDLRVQRRLMLAATEWLNSNHDASYLASGTKLAQFEILLNEKDLLLNQLESEYVITSVETRQRQEKQDQERQERELALARRAEAAERDRASRFLRASRVAAAIAVIAIFGIILAGFSTYGAIQQTNAANEQLRTATNAQGNAMATGMAVGLQVTIYALDLNQSITLEPALNQLPPTSNPTLSIEQRIATATGVAMLYNFPTSTPAQKINGVEMVLVPAGCFLMGSALEGEERPVSQVCFAQPFWLDKYEVTNALFDQFHGEAGTEREFSRGQQPRTHINWFEATAFCKKRDARLPTEAEWEYAARGPDSRKYAWGNNFIADNLVFAENSNSEPADVGSRASGTSWVGSYDTMGNAWEWTSSIFSFEQFPYPYNPNDGRENPDDIQSLRTVKGGSWFDDYANIRASLRFWNEPAYQDATIGFRCARNFE